MIFSGDLTDYLQKQVVILLDLKIKNKLHGQ